MSDESGDGDDEPIEKRVGEVLRERDATLAIAESCTGGLVGSRITDVSGASDYFDRSVVSYSYDAKRDLLAISRETLDDHGAVSEPVARQMARAVCDTADATWGLATTGIAGPDGGTDEDPVGTVYVGVANAAPWGTGESRTTVKRHVVEGTREEVKAGFVDRALTDLLERIESG
ncbi:CinA family protein [Halomarina litorea]|uniref:CinA family protein n=1 Tax=Halomarina litorea TaxID=2961595 RepID=UPI0020C2EE48|nr:CinA family protein [Halomarina sp. BCD28]